MVVACKEWGLSDANSKRNGLFRNDTPSQQRIYFTVPYRMTGVWRHYSRSVDLIV